MMMFLIMTTWSLYHCEASTKPSFLLQQQQPSSSVYLSHHCTQHSSTTTNSEAVSLSSNSFTGSWQLDHTVITLSDPSQCHQHCWHETWSWCGWDPRVWREIIWFFKKMNVDFMHFDVDLDLSTIIYHASHSSSSYHSTDSNLIMIV